MEICASRPDFLALILKAVQGSAYINKRMDAGYWRSRINAEQLIGVMATLFCSEAVFNDVLFRRWQATCSAQVRGRDHGEDN